MMRRKSLLHHFVVLVVVHRLQRRQLAQPPLSILAWRRTLAVDGSILVRKVCLPWCVRIQLRWNIKNGMNVSSSKAVTMLPVGGARRELP